MPKIGSPGRRDFLKLGGLVFTAAALPEWLSACSSSPAPPEVAGRALEAISVNLTVDPNGWFTVVRPADMLRVSMNFVQLHHDLPSNSLVVNAGAPSGVGVILMVLPPQHIVEQTVTEPQSGPPTTVPTPPVGAQIAGPTRLAFVVPSGTTVPYDLVGLLQACSKLNLNVAPNALAAVDDALPALSPVTLNSTTGSSSANPEQAIATLQVIARLRAVTDALSDGPPPADPLVTTNPPAPAAPADSQTAIELPYRLTVSPGSAARFAHSPTAYQPGTSTFTELWTTRLARALPSGLADDSARVPVSARAVWSPDLASPSDPFANPAFPAAARADLVTQTSDFTKASAQHPTRPFHARRLLLSARGGSLDTLSEFPNPVGSLLSWQHRASYGRDNYVRVEMSGVLFPWFHVASLVTISERKFLANPNNGGGARTAYLWQKQFLVILTPVVDYSQAPFSGFYSGQRNWAFNQIRILTPSTPPLDPAPPQTPPARFWPSINGGTAFRFAAQFVDLEGNVANSDLTAIWIPASLVNDRPTIQGAINDFSNVNDPNNAVRAQSNFGRQRVAYARPAAATSGTTSHETQAITFVGQTPVEGNLPFLPFIQNTKVNIAATRQFSGKDDALVLEYPQTYIDSGFDAISNKGEVYLSLLASGAPANVDFGAQSQRAGGFMTPSLAVLGLSRAAGPITGTNKGATVATQIQTFMGNAGGDASLLFAGALSKAKLFGVFSLGDLFGPPGTILKSLPKFTTEFLDVIGTLVRTLSQIQSALTDVQNAATSAANLGPLFAGQATKLGTDIGTFVATVSAFPPSSTFATDAGNQLATIATDVTNLSTTVASARVANSALPESARAPDVVFSRAISLLRAASAILTSGAQLTAALNAIVAASQAALNMTSHLEWQTQPGEVKPISLPGIPNVFFPDSSNKTVLKLVGEVRAHEVAGKPAGLDLTATLNTFAINLVGTGALAFLTLNFDHLTFKLLAGQKPDIDVGFSGITFDGPLSFLNALKSIIPLDGFGDPPGIKVDSRGIEGDFSFALPALSVGIFTLENINLGASFQIPFIGEPMTVGFHFSERDNPFHLTVSLLGGGGFFLMDLSMKGVVLIEASLEFGAEASINLVVASGTVLVMAGIYFSYAPAGSPPGVTLTGYVRIAGSLSVLGLITASVEMRLDLGWQSPSTAFGKATISIEVSILFFSESVDIHCEKSFSSCNADPTFADVMGPDVVGGPLTAWNEYCAAFAA